MSLDYEVPLVISVDDHVLEPPDLWTSRAPASIRDRVPRLVSRADRYTFKHGKAIKGPPDPSSTEVWDVWQFEDFAFPLFESLAAAGIDHDKINNGPIHYADVAAGAKFQKDRLVDMSSNHVEASACFPNTLPRFCGQTFSERTDRELGLWALRTYNDWVVEDWCGGEGAGRLIPVTVAPLWDAGLAAGEVERCAAKGSFALSFSENPTLLRLPSVYTGYWDPLFATCEATGTTLCIHVGSGSHVFTTTPEAPFMMGSTMAFMGSAGSLLDFIFSGVFDRFPGLKVMYSEGQAGWMPYVLGLADTHWTHRGKNEFGSYVPQPPSSYVPGRVYACIFEDDVALRERNTIGMDQICYETDYPHADGSFPHTLAMVSEMVERAGMSEGETFKFVRGNAIEALGLERFGIKDEAQALSAT